MNERQIEVYLKTGEVKLCDVVSAGQFVLECRIGDETFIVVRLFGAWHEVGERERGPVQVW